MIAFLYCITGNKQYLFVEEHFSSYKNTITLRWHILSCDAFVKLIFHQSTLSLTHKYSKVNVLLLQTVGS
jgi:hypothetical protein